jgi:hypothetical protein
MRIGAAAFTAVRASTEESGSGRREAVPGLVGTGPADDLRPVAVHRARRLIDHPGSVAMVDNNPPPVSHPS